MLPVLIVVFVGCVLLGSFAAASVRAARRERERLAPVAASVADVDVSPLVDLQNPQSQHADVAIRGRVAATERSVVNPATGNSVVHHKTAVYLMPVREPRPRLVHTIEEGAPFWMRDESGWAIVDATGASYSIRSPRGEIETKPLRRTQLTIEEAPKSLLERLANDIGHEPDPTWIRGYKIEQAVIEADAELTLYGRPTLARVDSLPEASPHYRQGSSLVPQFSGPDARVLFSEMDHEELEDLFHGYQAQEDQRERRAKVMLGVSTALGIASVFLWMLLTFVVR